MSTKLRTRKNARKLLLSWTEDRQFSVAVTVLPRLKPRFLKSSTISIHRQPKPAIAPPV